MNKAGTHLPVLKKIVSLTTGPVIEFGIGYNSTPILHEMCAGKKVVSLDNNQEWVRKFLHLQNADHQIMYVAGWEQAPVIPKGSLKAPIWSVAFIDHAPVERRVIDIERMRYIAEYIVVHDTESPIYEYEKVLTSFTYRHDYMQLSPHTTIVSMTKPAPFLVIELDTLSTNSSQSCE